MFFEKFCIKFLAFLVGTLCTYYLYEAHGLSPVLSSCLVGFVFSFLPKYKNIEVPPIVYCGSFAGMCSSSVINNYYELCFISMIGGAFYLLTADHFKGYGGKLGATAFTSVAVFLIARSLFT